MAPGSLEANLEPTKRVYENKNGLYQLPKDALEHDRLDGQSAALVALMNQQPFHAPITQPSRIIDIGCGTGSMTNLLAVAFPEATVIGIDIAPVPVSRHGKASNVEYVQGDIRDLMGTDSRIKPGSFDYVYQRLLFLGMTNWPDYISTIVALLKSGGWLEVQEASCQLRSQTGENISETWWHYPLWRESAAKLGLDIELGDKLCRLFESTKGLQNVHEDIYKFAGQAREEAPQLSSFEGSVQQLFTMLVKKMAASASRSEEEVSKMVADMNEMWANGLEPGSRFSISVAIGQWRGRQEDD